MLYSACFFVNVMWIIIQKISFASVSSWSKKKSNNWFQMTTLLVCDSLFLLTLVHNPSSIHTSTCVSAEIVARVEDRWIHCFYCACPTYCTYECRRHSSVYALPLILYIYRDLPTGRTHVGALVIDSIAWACNHLICISLKVNRPGSKTHNLRLTQNDWLNTSALIQLKFRNYLEHLLYWQTFQWNARSRIYLKMEHLRISKFILETPEC